MNYSKSPLFSPVGMGVQSHTRHGNACAGEGCENPTLAGQSLAMVYSPLQDFREIYDTDKALERGTLFAELDLPFEGGRGKKGAGLC